MLDTNLTLSFVLSLPTLFLLLSFSSSLLVSQVRRDSDGFLRELKGAMQELTSHCPAPDTFNADGTKQAVDQGIEDGERVRKYEELRIYGLFNFSWVAALIHTNI